MNSLVATELVQTALQIRAHVNLVQEVMKAVMIGPSTDNPHGVHYGTIPGTPKPSLFKPGAEVLGLTFKIAPSYRVEDLSTNDRIRYRVTCIGTHQPTSMILGEGMGECSTDEEKYKWRRAKTDAEFNAVPADRRREQHGHNAKQNSDYAVKQVRTEPADLANTVLKMACKRAQVAMILNVTAASDIFTQDIEDLPDELRGNHEGGDAGKHKEGAKGKEKPATYPPEGFKKNLAAWADLIRSGKKTIDDIKKTVGSRAPLSDAQVEELRKAALPAAEQQQQEGAKPNPDAGPIDTKPGATTFALVADKLNKADARDVLDLAADLSARSPTKRSKPS